MGPRLASLPVFSLLGDADVQVYIKGLDYDDRLLALAFADVGLFVTSISVFKNLILFGDAFKSMWFASLQVSHRPA